MTKMGMKIPEKRSIQKGFSLFAIHMMLVACAVAPVQEMSDARQAIDAAQAMVKEHAQMDEHVQRAVYLLQEAELQLREGKYPEARSNAQQAKKIAIQARERALRE